MDEHVGAEQTGENRKAICSHGIININENTVPQYQQWKDATHPIKKLIKKVRSLGIKARIERKAIESGASN